MSTKQVRDNEQERDRRPIAYLTGEYPRATDTFVQREVAALRRRGFTVLTCSIRRTAVEHHVGPEQRQEAQDTYHVLAAATSPVTFIAANFRAIANNPARYFRALMLAVQTSPPGLIALAYQMVYFMEAVVLGDYLKKQDVRHLHNHIAKSSCTVAMLASAVSGVPYSFTLHGPDIFFEPKYWRLDAKIAQAKFVSCISDFCRSQAMIFATPTDWDKLHIVHCGVEPDRYINSTQTTRSSPDEPMRLIFVGRLAAVKGLRILFAALQQLKDDGYRVSVTLVGDGPERTSLEHDVQKRDLTSIVSFVGYKSQTDVAELLTSHDGLILPSFAEGLPVVLMEAMAASRFVIATRIAGVPELVEHGVNGLLVSPSNVNELAESIIQISTNAEWQERFGKNARERVIQDFNSDTEAGRLADLIDGREPPARLPYQATCHTENTTLQRCY